MPPAANPVLSALEPLVGDWRLELSNAAFLPAPDAVLTVRVHVEWAHGGAALMLRHEPPPEPTAGPAPPASTWLVGRDDSGSEYTVLYSDERGVSRVYAMTLQGHDWQMRRDAPGFAQRFHATIAVDGAMIEGFWQKSIDGDVWERDFDLRYTRL